jgi:DNA-directed RNA polymerase specialized sigma24 family protein
VMLKLCQRAAQGRGLGSGTTDGEQITYLKAILANQARDRGRRAQTRGPETHIDDPDVHVEPEHPEPEERLIERLPVDLRDLVRAAAADRDPERRMVEDVLGPAFEAARAARRSDHREALDQSWREMIALNFEGADSVQLLIRYGGYNPAMPATLAAKRNAREQRHRSCRNNILEAAQGLHDAGVWGAERLDLARYLIESLKNPQSA